MLSRDPLLPELDKVSIREFNGRLGGLSTLQAKDRTGYTKRELKRMIAYKLCAQAVEKEFFENVNGENKGGNNWAELGELGERLEQLKQAKKKEKIVGILGLDRLTKSNLGTTDSKEAHSLAERYLLEIGMDESRFLISGNRQLVSKKFLKNVEKEKENIINDAFQFALEFVRENFGTIEMLRNELKRREILTGKEVSTLLKNLKN